MLWYLFINIQSLFLFLCYIVLLSLYREWPVGGLQELRHWHDVGWAYFGSLVMLSKAGAKLNASQIAYGTRFTVSSMWTVVENARPMAVEMLRLSGYVTFLFCLLSLLTIMSECISCSIILQ
jgi:hypothetical protein